MQSKAECLHKEMGPFPGLHPGDCTSLQPLGQRKKIDAMGGVVGCDLRENHLTAFIAIIITAQDQTKQNTGFLIHQWASTHPRTSGEFVGCQKTHTLFDFAPLASEKLSIHVDQILDCATLAGAYPRESRNIL